MNMKLETTKYEMEKIIRSHIQGRDQGFFVTIDTAFIRPDFLINNEFLKKFAGKMKTVTHPLNIFAYGRNYRRYEEMKQHGMPTTAVHKLSEVTAYEIGECGRFHLHSMLLHDGGCTRTVEDVKNRLLKICPHNPYTFLDGDKALHVVAYDPSKEDRWIQYFLKSYDYFKNRYGFLNIDVK